MRFRRFAERLAKILTVTKRTDIIIETGQGAKALPGRFRRSWCRECGHEVEVVGLSQVETLETETKPLLREFGEIQGWHVFEDQDGALLICLESVTRPK
jgi:hypothetical protein